MLLIEPDVPFPLRFNHIVLITRVVRHHGGGVTLYADGRHYDASSVFEIIQSLGVTPAARRFAFVGEEPALSDLGRLCRHLLSNGHPESVPQELAYLR
jgi:hypothetical protein